MPSAQVQISQLPAAGPITGAELVPVVQNGQTVRTTAADISSSPSQTQTFLTVNAESTLPNSRYLSTGSGMSLTDNGPQGPYRIQFTGIYASLGTVSPGVLVNVDGTNIVARTFQTSGNGLSVTNGDGVSGSPTFSLTGQVLSLANASGAGLVALPNNGTVTPRVIQGVASEIDVTDGDGASGNPLIGLADNPVVPGVEGVVLPSGNTGDRASSPVNGTLRYNNQTQTFEGYANNSWGAITTGSGVTSVGLLMPGEFTVTNSPVTSTGDLTAAWASQTSGKFFASPASSTGTPAFRAILASDVPTLNQNTTGQAGSVANSVTFNTSGGAAPGAVFDGSAARTIDYSTVGAPKADGTGATGTWAINISGNAATATAATTATSATTATTAGSATTSGTATNIAGGAANRIPYQTSAGATSFVVAPTVPNTYLEWSGSAFQWSANPLGTVSSVDVSGGTTGLTTSGGPITSSGTITISGVLVPSSGGTGISSYAVGDLLFANTTTTLDKLTVGAAGRVLASNGTAPAYVEQSTLSVGSATNASNVAVTASTTNATHYLTFVSAISGNRPVLVNSGITCNPSTGEITSGISGGTF